MSGAAYYFVNGMESEASVIARGLRRRDPELLDRLIDEVTVQETFFASRFAQFRDRFGINWMIIVPQAEASQPARPAARAATARAGSRLNAGTNALTPASETTAG